MIKAWRWLLVPPAAAAVYFISIIWLPYFAAPTEDFGTPWWAIILGSTFLGLLVRTVAFCLSVVAGAFVAPNHRFITATVLASIIGVLVIGGDLSFLIQGKASQQIWLYIAEIVLTGVALLITCSIMYAWERDRATALPMSAKPTKYVSSATGTIYHYPDCELATRIRSQNEILFKSAAEARATGHTACKVCKPPLKD